jgi:hypothetical protein
MTIHASLPLAQALRIVPGVPSVFSASAADRSPPLSPPKSWAWWIEQNGCRIGPPTCGGTAVIGEATDGDGDENSSRDNGLIIWKDSQGDRIRKTQT